MVEKVKAVKISLTIKIVITNTSEYSTESITSTQVTTKPNKQAQLLL